jgi:hypothetical protein
MLSEFGLIVGGAVLAPAVRMMDQPWCRAAHDKGLAEGCQGELPMQPISATAQPTMPRANRSITTARYSQPSRVQIYEMSLPHF